MDTNDQERDWVDSALDQSEDRGNLTVGDLTNRPEPGEGEDTAPTDEASQGIADLKEKGQDLLKKLTGE
jgi:hypothetical protein